MSGFIAAAEHPFHGPVHHLAYLVDDLEAAVDLTAAATLGHHVELHGDCQQLRDVFGMVRDASVSWDGSNSLRSVT